MMNKSTMMAMLVTALAVSSMVLSPLLADDSDAATIECNGATIGTFVEGIEINAGNTSTFYINVFNNTPADLSIKINYVSPTDTVVLSFSEADSIIKSGSGKSIAVTVTADKYAHQSTDYVTLNFGVMSSDGKIASASSMISINVLSEYSSNDDYNKILGVFSNPLPYPFNTPLATTLITLALWIFISLVLTTIVLRLMLRLFFREEKDERVEIRKEVGKLLLACIMLYGVSVCMRVYGVSEYYVATMVSISEILYIIIGAIVIWRIYRSMIKFMFTKASKRNSGVIDDSLVPLFKMLGKIVIAVTGFASVLAVMGFNLVAIITGAGIAGLAISLGAQNTLNQFFCGITILLTRPFIAGDMIRLNSNTDILEVRRVGIINTEFKNWSNAEIFTMPNSAVANATIINMTGDGRAYRIEVYFGVSYDSDLELVKRILLETANEHPSIIKDGSYDIPATRLTSFDNSCITFRLTAYVNDFEDNGVIGGELREAVFKKFEENKIEIPFSQLDVRLTNVTKQ